MFQSCLSGNLDMIRSILVYSNIVVVVLAGNTREAIFQMGQDSGTFDRKGYEPRAPADSHF